MAYDQNTRNRLQRFVSEARNLLSGEFARQFQQKYGLDASSGEVSELERLVHLNDREMETARMLRDTLTHYLASSPSGGKRECLERMIREQAFTVLNRLCALRMAEAREIIIESLSRTYNSKGFQLYARLAGTALGETGDAYRAYIFSLFDELALDLPVLFDRFSPQGYLFPGEGVLLELLAMMNDSDLSPLWVEDETIGWIYQYFNSLDERRQMRSESQAPRNSRELAVRNQFFTPRYVVEFLTDNTLGRLWYEMTRGETQLKVSCKYLVRRPQEIFLAAGEEAPETEESTDDLSQEEMLQQAVYISYRPLKDPREILMLDPACGSMHFGLYAFDLYEKIYQEAWDLESQLGSQAFERSENLQPLQQTYASREEFLRDVPRLIVECNIHGVDIDSRAVQIAGLSLWLRSQRSWLYQGLKPQQRPQIRKSNVVCAEPMPGEKGMLEEFVGKLKPRVLGQLVEMIFNKMQLAGEAGSLLKIEEEIEDVLNLAREEFQKEIQIRNEERSTLFPYIIPPRQSSLFDFTDLGDKTRFWNYAEERLLDALEEYAEQAEGTEAVQKRLFAHDAARGFAFIDLFRKRYDVVLMNPPFGEPALLVKSYFKDIYSNQSYDLYCYFVNRACMITNSGKVGAISSDSFLRYTDYSSFRDYLTTENHIDCLVHLGWDVLDTAYVSTCAYVLNMECPPYSIFVDCTNIREDTDEKVYHLLSDFCIGKPTKKFVFLHPLNRFNSIESKPICYRLNQGFFKWVQQADSLRNLTKEHGIGAGPHNIFFRLFWEIPQDEKGNYSKWPGLVNGGSFSPYYRDHYLCIDWRGDGKHIKEHLKNLYPYLNGNIGIKIQREHIYFQPGITYGKRSERFNAQVMPSGMIPSFNGIGLYPKSDEDIWWLLGYLNTRSVAYYLNLICGLHKNAVYIDRVPIPSFSDQSKAELSNLVKKIYELIRCSNQSVETSNYFLLPVITVSNISTIRNNLIEWLKNDRAREAKAWELTQRAEEIVSSYLDFGQAFNEEVNEDQGPLIKLTDSKDNNLLHELVPLPNIKAHFRPIINRDEGFDLTDLSKECLENDLTIENAMVKLNKNNFIDPNQLVWHTGSLFSWLFGSVFGRWDICYAIGQKESPELPDPFASIPVCPPGMLQNEQGFPAIAQDVPTDYPLRISWSGILVDEEGQPEDIVARVREALEVIWKEKAGDIEQEACEILGVDSLRYYFRKPNNFFAEHLKRYSKSRRQAPIYWPLSTASGSYTIWLYYQRLNDQTLYRCVNDYAEPKLKQVMESARQLRQKTGRSQQEERELEELVNLEQELQEFRDELLRVASFWKPDLNDGVQITAAPLWRLFRLPKWRTTLKDIWEKLEKGDYDWAHLAYSIWPQRVREKCKHDKSLAIAHDLEDIYEEPVAQAKKKGGRGKKNT